MQKIIIALILISLSSCASDAKKEAAKSAKAGAASQRINSSDENSSKIFKELDE